MSDIANMKVVDSLLDKVNWREVVIKRHHKYIIEYLKCDKNMNKVSKVFEMSIENLLSIFLRIQKQLVDGKENVIVIKDDNSKDEYVIPGLESMSKLDQLFALVNHFPDWDSHVTVKQRNYIVKVAELNTDNWTEIAKHFGVSKSAVYTNLVSENSSALKRLRERLA